MLAELLDHRNLNVTRGYYRVGEERRRGAVNKVTAMQFDRHGNRIWRDARALLDDEHARYAVGSVAVPYGTCTEPSNVAAGGNDCPVRFRCAGCDHFRTDVSYLPDLTAYLDDLLRTRERLAAATGIDTWARDQAAPADQEITVIRQLISRIKGDIAGLSPDDRARIDEAVAVVRKHRAVSIGMPRLRPAAQPCPLRQRKARPHDQPPASSRHRRRRAHRDDAQRPPGRLRPAPAARPDRPRPRRRQRDRDQRLGHRPRRRRRPDLPLPASRPAGEDPRGRSQPRPPAAKPQDLPSPAHPCKPTCSPPTNAPSGSAARVRQLEQRLSDALGEQAWRESGLGAPADIDALHQKITHLEQQAADLRLQLEERGDELSAARAANRELMTRLNQSAATR